jgi:hypothetical protein
VLPLPKIFDDVVPDRQRQIREPECRPAKIQAEADPVLNIFRQKNFDGQAYTFAVACDVKLGRAPK